jgi:hypothetical protein
MVMKSPYIELKSDHEANKPLTLTGHLNCAAGTDADSICIAPHHEHDYRSDRRNVKLFLVHCTQKLKADFIYLKQWDVNGCSN